MGGQFVGKSKPNINDNRIKNKFKYFIIINSFNNQIELNLI